MMTQAKTRTLTLGVRMDLALNSAREQFWERCHRAEADRGAQSLEWALIAAIAVGLVAIVAIKITAAVNSHAAQIK